MFFSFFVSNLNPTKEEHMWEQLLELLKNNQVSKAIEAIAAFEPADFELSVEFYTGEMDIYEAQMTRKRFARYADTVAGSKRGPDKAAWINVAYNLTPANGRSSVSRSYNR